MIITNGMKISNNMQKSNKQEGLTLLIAILLGGVLLGVSTSLLNITLKQYQLSGIALASETAFQAANAGMECILYYDFPKTGASIFDVHDDGSDRPAVSPITCMSGVSSIDLANISPDDVGSGEEQRFQFSWGAPAVCVDVSIYKYSSNSGAPPIIVNGVATGATCAVNTVCTVIQSRGYNVPCSDIASGARVVEREYTQVY